MVKNGVPRSPSSLTDFNSPQFIHLLTLMVVLFPLLVPAALPGQGVTFAGTSPSVNFGSVNICPAGQTTPAPCSETLALSFTITASGTLGATRVLTVGAPDLDFTLASGSTCTGSVTAGTNCTANINFAPRFAGLRRGGVEIVDSSGDVLADVAVYGIGSGPQITFQPGVQSALGTGLNQAEGVAVDESGNLFVADTQDYQVKEILAAGGYTTIKTLAGGFSYPYGIAVDGSRNLYVADWGESDTGIHEILAAGGYTTMRTLGSGFNSPLGVAVDGSGNVFVADYGNGAVKEILAAGDYTTVETLAGSGMYNPWGVAVDGSGNVFAGDYSNSVVIEIPAAGGYGTFKTLASGLANPRGVAVDAAGNVFVADFSHGALKEILAAGGYATFKTLASGLNAPSGLAVDGRGNAFIAQPTTVSILRLDYADPPSVIFPTQTPAGSRDTADGARTISVWNSGNQPLHFATTATGNNPDYPADFPENTSDVSLCAGGVSLAVGSSCDVSVNFVPSVDGVNTGSVMLTDNALNGNPGTQSIGLEGTGGVGEPVFAPKPGVYQYTQNVTLSYPTPYAVPIYYTLDGTVPTSRSTKYTGPIPVGWQSTINAIAISSEAGSSPVVSGTYTIDRQLQPPIFSPPSGTYGEPLTFTLTPNPAYCAPGACEIYYTVDGEGFQKYTGPITITKFGTTPVKAIATEWHYTTSNPANVIYEVK
jgi:sugar lactone lactonase YvrE